MEIFKKDLFQGAGYVAYVCTAWKTQPNGDRRRSELNSKSHLNKNMVGEFQTKSQLASFSTTMAIFRFCFYVIRTIECVFIAWLLTVERTTSLLHSYRWHGPFCSAQACSVLLLKNSVLSNVVWSFSQKSIICPQTRQIDIADAKEKRKQRGTVIYWPLVNLGQVWERYEAQIRAWRTPKDCPDW
jgi:hypothetical protein